MSEDGPMWPRELLTDPGCNLTCPKISLIKEEKKHNLHLDHISMRSLNIHILLILVSFEILIALKEKKKCSIFVKGSPLNCDPKSPNISAVIKF